MTWLAWKSAYSSSRGVMAVVGAHAFADGAEHSLCGYAPRAKAGGEASADARRCVKCERLMDSKPTGIVHRDVKPVNRPSTRADPRPKCPVCGAAGVDRCRDVRGLPRWDHEMRRGGPVGRTVQLELTVRAHRRLCRAARIHGVKPAAMLEILARWLPVTRTRQDGR